MSLRRCGIAENEEMRYCQSETNGECNVIELWEERNKEKEKREIWVKMIFGGTWSTGSYVASTCSTGSMQMVLSLRGATNLVQSLQTVLQLRECYMAAGTKPTGGIKDYGGLWRKKLYGKLATAGYIAPILLSTEATADYASYVKVYMA